MIESLDHVNVRTARTDEMVRWYGEVLDMHPGDRPDFDVPGAWLYANGAPIVHLVSVAGPTAQAGDDTQLEHAAFAAKGLGGFLERLDARGERYRLSRVEAAGIIQVNVWDPDGNHLHIDFPMDEADALGV